MAARTPTTTSPSEAERRRTGVVSHWRPEGWGFVIEDGTRRKLYVHASQVHGEEEFVNLREGLHVEFTLALELQGPAAHDVCVLGAEHARRAQ